MSAAESDAYFATRPRESQLGAWASPQSEVVADRAELDRAYAEVAARFADAGTVPRPPHWGGWRVTPAAIEFWQGRVGRMHDRLRYERSGGGWRRSRLAP
jgi:pyridoxamine 5'-phosphate oxidase